MNRKKLVAIGAAAVVFIAGAVVLARIGPRNVIGMIRYDQREEGKLKPGDLAPSVELLSPDGARREAISAHIGEKPLVLIFGSFT